MSNIYYTIHSFSATNAKYVDVEGMGNYCVFDTMDRIHHGKEYSYWGGEKAFKRRQAVYEELLEKKHGGAEVTLLEDSEHRETYLIRFANGFILIKESESKYYNGGEYVDRSITYSIPEEGWNESEPLDRLNDIGCITKYGDAY